MIKAEGAIERIKIETYWNVNTDDSVAIKANKTLKQKHIGM